MPTGTNAAQFAKMVNEYADKTVQLIAKDAASQIFTEVATLILEATPVLTGHARHNWVPNVGTTTPGDEIDGVAGVSETGASLTGDETTGIADAVKQFQQGSATQINFTNNAPYIQLLDQGSSQKAPAGIVDPSISAALAALKDKLKITTS